MADAEEEEEEEQNSFMCPDGYLSGGEGG